jgi:RNase H-like domain found in reverse transcriptase
MKAVMAQDAFLRYPDHNKPFHIYCDASDLQLGAVIVQDNAPVAFYSHKLNSATEKEILSIVKTLKEYCTLLYGCQNIYVCTDHNTFTNLQTQHVLCWHLFL